MAGKEKTLLTVSKPYDMILEEKRAEVTEAVLTSAQAGYKMTMVEFNENGHSAIVQDSADVLESGKCDSRKAKKGSGHRVFRGVKGG